MDSYRPFGVWCTHAFAAALIALTSPLVTAALVLSYDFEGDGGAFENSPNQIDSNLFAEAWFLAIGTPTSPQGASGSDNAISAKNFTDENSFLLSLEIAPGFALSLEEFSFDQRRSGTGPTTWMLFIAANDFVLASGTTSEAFDAVNGSLGLNGLTGIIEIEIRATGASSTSGTLRIDNFQLQGSLQAVPLPFSAILFFSSALMLGYFSCWRHGKSLASAAS